MEFFTSSDSKRPIRLSAKIRRWAYESMHGKYGDEAMKTPYIEIEEENFNKLDDLDKYDIMITEIAKKAPIRVCEEELISGSATLGAAISHVIPAYHKGEKIFSSVSHLTIDYETALRFGMNFYL